MRKLSIDYVAEGTGGAIYARSADGTAEYVDSVAIDSRKVSAGCLFFCIIGARNDAHEFLPDVREKGCRSVVVSDEKWAEEMKKAGDMNVVLVEDTTKALMKLAARYMDDWPDLIRIGVTGSVGKTTTKEFIYSVVSSRYRTGKTPGNLNSHYGIPLTVFGFDDDIEVAVIEMGVGYGSYMSELSAIAKPDIAVITNVGNSHKEVFGSREGLLKEKLAITSGMPDGSVLIVNSDCDMLGFDRVRELISEGIELGTVGTNDGSDYLISEVLDRGIDGVSCRIRSYIYELDGDSEEDQEKSEAEEYEMKLPLIGEHNLTNAAEAVAVGEVLGIAPADSVKALMNAEHHANRLEILRGNGLTVINDSYNASPESMKAALKVLGRSGGRKVAVLGSMYELGDDRIELHRLVGRAAVEEGVDVLVTIGDEASYIAEEAAAVMAEKMRDRAPQSGGCGPAGPEGMEIFTYMYKPEAITVLKDITREGDVVLVKASRSVGLEEVAHALIG